jgi:Secretion system C-terminal sorting domain
MNTNIQNNTNKSFIYILFIILILNTYKASAQLRIYPKSLVLTSQYSVDTFQNNYDVIKGALYIGTSDSTHKSDITDISKLLGIKAVWGDIDVMYNGRLKTLHGLDSIVVADNLGSYFIGNDSLETLEALNNWTLWADSIDVTIRIEKNKSLHTLGFKNLNYGGYIVISNNLSLKKISGFNNISKANISINYSAIDSFNGFDKSNFVYLEPYNSYVKSFAGLKNVKNLGLNIINSTMDSIVGNPNSKIYKFNLDNCPNLKKIDYGRPSDPIGYKSTVFYDPFDEAFFTYATTFIAKNCPILKEINAPLRSAKSTSVYIEKCNKFTSICFDSATYLLADFRECEAFSKMEVPLADTLSFVFFKCPNITDFIAPKASLLEGFCSFTKARNLYFPSVTRIRRGLKVMDFDSTLNFVYLPLLEDAIGNTIKGHNQATSLVNLQSNLIDSVKNVYNTRFYMPKFTWGSLSLKTSDNSTLDFSKLEEFNVMVLRVGNDKMKGNIIVNANIKLNQFLDIDSMRNGDVFNYLGGNRYLGFGGNFDNKIPVFKNINKPMGLGLQEMYQNIDYDFVPKKLFVFYTFNGHDKFTNISFLSKLDSLENSELGYIKYLWIAENTGLSDCSSVCKIIKNSWDTYMANGVKYYRNININNNKSGCDSIVDILSNCTNVSTYDLKNTITNTNYIQVYPNPSNSGDVVNFPLSEYGVIHYDLYNIQGNNIYSNTDDGFKHRIVLPDLTQGLYVIKITQNNKYYFSKIVIQ